MFFSHPGKLLPECRYVIAYMMLDFMSMLTQLTEQLIKR